MRLYRASRRELFEQLDRPAFRPLPAEAFVYGEWKLARVNLDYHVECRGHYYSVPYALVHEAVDVRVTAATVEIFHRGQRVSAHGRDDTRGRHTTLAAHMPKAHQRHLEWTPSRITDWAGTIGPQTAALAAAILADRPHPEQGYRSCLGLLRLAKRPWGHAAGGGVWARPHRRGPLLSPCRLDPQARPRPPSAARGSPTAPPRSRPRTPPGSGLLPVKERPVC
jgi:transposase